MITPDRPYVEIFDMWAIKQRHHSVHVILRWVDFVREIHVISHGHQKVDVPTLLCDVSNVSIQGIKIQIWDCHI